MRCANCGKIITMSNGNTAFFSRSDICGDCAKANTGMDYVILCRNIDQEKKDQESREYNSPENRRIREEEIDRKIEMSRANREYRREVREREEAVRIEALKKVVLARKEAYRKNKKIRDHEEMRERLKKEAIEYLISKNRLVKGQDIELDKSGLKFRVKEYEEPEVEEILEEFVDPVELVKEIPAEKEIPWSHGTLSNVPDYFPNFSPHIDNVQRCYFKVCYVVMGLLWFKCWF